MLTAWLPIIFIHLLIKNSTQIDINNSICDTEEFDCGEGTLRCLPSEWRCDNKNDCMNGEDEIGCPNEIPCIKGFLLCKNGLCVPAEFKCDGEDDCGDQSDEQHCEYYWFNGRNDPNCQSPRMQCRSGQCIGEDRICDEHEDCLDGDDEKNCMSRNAGSIETLHSCRVGYSSCLSGDVCIPDSFLCDGEKDCYDGSDETSCADCMKTTTGTECTCRQGYHLSSDGMRCIAGYSCIHTCQHLCDDRVGVCECYKGYILEADGHSCTIEGSTTPESYVPMTSVKEKNELGIRVGYDGAPPVITNKNEFMISLFTILIFVLLGLSVVGCFFCCTNRKPSTEN